MSHVDYVVSRFACSGNERLITPLDNGNEIYGSHVKCLCMTLLFLSKVFDYLGMEGVESGLEVAVHLVCRNGGDVNSSSERREFFLSQTSLFTHISSNAG